MDRVNKLDLWWFGKNAEVDLLMSSPDHAYNLVRQFEQDWAKAKGGLNELSRAGKWGKGTCNMLGIVKNSDVHVMPGNPGMVLTLTLFQVTQ